MIFQLIKTMGLWIYSNQNIESTVVATKFPLNSFYQNSKLLIFLGLKKPREIPSSQFFSGTNQSRIRRDDHMYF